MLLIAGLTLFPGHGPISSTRVEEECKEKESKNEKALAEEIKQRKMRMEKLERAGVDIAKLRRLLDEYEDEKTPVQKTLLLAAQALLLLFVCFIGHVAAKRTGFYSVLAWYFPRETAVLSGFRTDL